MIKCPRLLSSLRSLRMDSIQYPTVRSALTHRSGRNHLGLWCTLWAFRVFIKGYPVCFTRVCFCHILLNDTNEPKRQPSGRLTLCQPAVPQPGTARLQLAWTLLSHALRQIPRNDFINIHGVIKYWASEGCGPPFHFWQHNIIGSELSSLPLWHFFFFFFFFLMPCVFISHASATMNILRLICSWTCVLLFKTLVFFHYE